MAAEVLDLLLLVFIIVELLFAVRTTLAERELIAEPFLLVGIIASIKEIVVLSVKAPDLVGTDEMPDTLWLMGVLTVTIVVLAVSSLLLRRKEREPSEGDSSGPDQARERPRPPTSVRTGPRRPPDGASGPASWSGSSPGTPPMCLT